MPDNRIIAVVGPTASGKSALAVALAKELDGEIISCDSMQIYKGMDIGTAKVTKDEMQGIPHHLIDITEPVGDFSCADYSVLAKQAVNDIQGRKKQVIFCGGTGLYLDSVIGISGFSEAGTDEAFRAEMARLCPEELHKKLQAIDPVSAQSTHANNVKRVIRALEIYHLTGKTKSYFDARSREIKPPYRSTVIGIDFRDRQALYERINLRVDIMLQNGLLDEVKRLDCPEFRASVASEGIGYKEILKYLDGDITLPEAVEQIKQGSRNYAKRQRTWFKRNKDIKWLYNDDFEGEQKFKLIVNYAINLINNN